MRIVLLTVIFFFLSLFASSQVTYQHISDDAVYELLDELADYQVIEMNSIVKPYGRKLIAQKLKEALESGKLNIRMKNEVKLYLQELGFELGEDFFSERSLIDKKGTRISWLPPVFTHRDTNGYIGIRPVYGIRYFSNSNNSFYHSYGGAELWSGLGDHWGIYASLRDNYQQKEVLALPSYLTNERGGAYKINVQNREGGDYSEMRGGITYSGVWGHVGLVKDHVEWGTNYNGSNIFSGRTPSFAMIKLQLKPFDWLQFDYYHGWLVSQVLDSLRSYYTVRNDYRGVYREKYIAANMYTVRPFKHFNFAFGNSIVYSDMDFQPAYLIPFFFFKSLDHTLNRGIENQNSQMFLNVSSRNIKHLHLFSSVFIDEFSVTRVNDESRHNFFSYKMGAGLTGWPVSNAGLKAEYTRTSPLTYKHRVPSTTFASNRFNLGHYLTDNSEDLFIELWAKPHYKWKTSVSYNYALHGRDHEYTFNVDVPLDELSFLEEKTWQKSVLNVELEWQPSASFAVFGNFQYANYQGYELDGNSASFYLNRFTPEYLHGKTNTLIVGFRYGR